MTHHFRVTVEHKKEKNTERTKNFYVNQKIKLIKSCSDQDVRQ